MLLKNDQLMDGYPKYGIYGRGPKVLYVSERVEFVGSVRSSEVA